MKEICFPIIYTDLPRPYWQLYLHGPVGSGGKNHPDDTRLVQSLLNAAAGQLRINRTLKIDGLIGPLTIAAIMDIQKLRGCVVDGRVDPGNKTIRVLLEIAKQSNFSIEPFKQLRNVDDFAAKFITFSQEIAAPLQLYRSFRK